MQPITSARPCRTPDATPTRRRRSAVPPARPAATTTTVKLAVVVQRYGADINGGAELHARYVAEHLARHAEVEVLTTCARDYVTWANELPAGVEQVHGVPVRRFPVARERDVNDFARRQDAVFDRAHSIAGRARVARCRRPDQPRAARHVRDSRRRTTGSSSSATATSTPFTARARCADRAVLVPDRRARRGHRPGDVRAGVPRRARADVQLARRTRDDPARRRRPTTCRASSSASAPTCPRTREPSDSASSSASRARLRSTSAGSTRTRAARSCSTSSSATAAPCAASSTWCSSARRSCRSRAPADPPSRVPRRRAEVRRDGGGRTAGHAVVLREPLDGRARGLGDRQAGARQRQMRRAEGPGDPQQRGALLRELRRVRRNAPCHHVERGAAAARSGGTAARSSAPTTRGR